MMLRMLISPRTLSGMWADTMERELKKHEISEVGLTADMPDRFREAAMNACRVTLFDTLLTAGQADLAERLPSALEEARALGADTVCVAAGGADAQALFALVKAANKSGLGLLVSSRGAHVPGLCRACRDAGALIALDTGYSNCHGSALEDLYDALPVLGAVLLNDNDGEQDDMRAPGYGTLPIGALGEALTRFAPDADIYISGTPRQDLPFVDPNLGLCLRETRVALSGRVPVNPAGGWLARDGSGRILL